MGQPLQNRVLPTGEIVAVPERGTFMGNRGGPIHDPVTRTLGRRRWASRRWICCLTCFKDRRRNVMGTGYTELFFLDEVTALAAGHRPCFECRRADARSFAAAFETAGQKLGEYPGRPSADDMDRILHRDRLDGASQKTFLASLGEIPAGTMIAHSGHLIALHGCKPVLWTLSGYQPCPIDLSLEDEVQVLTPRSIVDTLRQGYLPIWHKSATLIHSSS
ncbi:hypothetical protein [Roseibium sp.]|uniref:hypothetical protein n=1 Tax=Roseibium sp. TaxID=1936156 RepID=UPI003A96FE06